VLARPYGVGKLANDEAIALRHEYVGTEHYLLAIARMRGTVAAQVLKGYGVTPDEVQAAIRRIVNTVPAKRLGRLPLTLRAKKAIGLSIEEARLMGSNTVSTEHLLLALLRVDDGVAIQALREMIIDITGIRRAIIAGLEQI